jgi:hypothetical protein
VIVNPRLGQVVRVRYNAKVRASRPLHDRVGKVVVVSRRKPRNHGVEINGVLYVVPCGNLMPERSEP